MCGAFEKLGFVDGHDRVLALRRVGRQEPLDPADARLHVGGLGGLSGAVEFIGQVGQQIGRRHLRKDQMHERRALLAQHAAQHGRQRVLPEPEGPANSAAPRRFSMAYRNFRSAAWCDSAG